MSLKLKRISTIITVATAGLCLTACGGATVDSSEVSSPAVSESSASSPAAKPSQPQTSTAPSGQHGAPAPGAGDQPAREVESAPEPATRYSPEEQTFLEALSNQGISVQGIEDQLTGTGLSICDGNTITRDAVAGQLIEQGRSELDAEAISTLIDDNAHEHLC